MLMAVKTAIKSPKKSKFYSCLIVLLALAKYSRKIKHYIPTKLKLATVTLLA